MSNLFRVNARWFVNLDEIFDIGTPKNDPNIILITKKNGTTVRYQTDNPEAVLERLEEFLSYKHSCPSIKDPIDPYIDYSEIKTNIIKKFTED
jgi:hypothetical protein